MECIQAGKFKEDRTAHPEKRPGPLELIAKSTIEVRSAIVYATVIVALVRCCRCSCRALRRSMQPLAVAHICRCWRRCWCPSQ
jgi:hypothetical protein